MITLRLCLPGVRVSSWALGVHPVLSPARGAGARPVRRTRDPELGGSAVGWLFGIARHQLLRAMQRGQVEQRARDRLGIGRIELDDDELERLLAFAESEPTATQLTTALDALPPDQRAALNARVLEEQDYNAIARSSGTAEATIRKRVSRALDSLRNARGEQR